MAEGAGLTPMSGGSSTANLRFGVYKQSMPYVGKTVKQARTELMGQWQGLPGDAQAYKGKEQLADDYVIKEGDAIEFQRKTGEKGTLSF